MPPGSGGHRAPSLSFIPSSLLFGAQPVGYTCDRKGDAAMSHMLDEIREQPEIVRNVIDTQYRSVEALRDAMVKRNIRFAYVAARGTSDNVANYAKYVLEIEHGIPIALAAPSVF